MRGLRIEELTRRFGGLTAVKNLSFEVPEGSITGLIGPNGSGKTVTFDCITGFYRPDRGRVLFHDQDITALRPNEIAFRGIGRSFQITGVFARLTVRQNLSVAAQDKPLWQNVVHSLRRRDGLDPGRTARIDTVLQTLDLPPDELVANLPHGYQKILEFGALMLMVPEPTFFLLDEPFAGLTVTEIARYVELMRVSRASGKTFLVVEHNMRMMMDVCERLIVLDHGEKIAEGTPGQIQTHPRVLEAYLGHAGAAGSRRPAG
jgi:branched-chain amino acid transport system ATP-binding protein